MKRRELLKQLGVVIPALALASNTHARGFFRDFAGEKILKGPFEPTWESLQQYVVPDWYRNAKFGIWAHWGPQCEPEAGDWYARGMYEEGSRQYNYHIKSMGIHQSLDLKM
nr:alpha-L-fucosidase [Niabella hibiscisoli]